jgi:hypothetical protein
MGAAGTGLLAFQGRQAEPTTVVPTRRVRSVVPESPRFSSMLFDVWLRACLFQ